MPNYILSRTSPPAHIYERKVNLGYGIKVDTSDAPKSTPEPNKGKNMNVQVVGVANDKPAVFADGTVLEGHKDRGEFNTETQVFEPAQEAQGQDKD